jgi:2-(1,2-epoxy-1,2-dihydrophenyl)acetyl-CoA isomerase
MELLYFPTTLSAAESADLGLATTVVSDDEFAGEVAALAHRLASGPTTAYGAIRRSVAHSAEHGFAESLAFESQMMTLTGATDDHRRAVDAFLAKEKPTFTGS